MSTSTMKTATRKKPRRLSLLDATFLQIERRETPTHVAGLQVFQLPKNAPKDFIKSVVQTLRGPEKLARPWNLKLAPVPLSRLAPAMVETDDIDMDYHVRHTCLPAPGGERELGELVSHLHSVTLDRSRPLWTCHVIEGLGPSIDPETGQAVSGNRFALYTKIHHTIIDGVKGMHLLTRCLGDAPGANNWTAPWADVERPADAREKDRFKSKRDAKTVSALGLPKAVKDAWLPLLRRGGAVEPIRLPFEAPRSILNGSVTAARRVATQRLDLGRIKKVAAASGASVNDVFLAISSAALRRHLLDSHQLPARSLVAGVPVSLRADSKKEDAGNAVGFLWSVLGTDIADPLERLQTIRDSMEASKRHLQSLPGSMRSLLTMMTMSPAIAVLLSGQGAKVRPPMNVVISNVPGPQRTLYMGRARLEAIYPVSIPMQGQALNISCVSYDGQLTVGFTGSRDCLPHLQRLAVYASEALDELEAAMSKDVLPPDGKPALSNRAATEAFSYPAVKSTSGRRR